MPSTPVSEGIRCHRPRNALYAFLCAKPLSDKVCFDVPLHAIELLQFSCSQQLEVTPLQLVLDRAIPLRSLSLSCLGHFHRLVEQFALSVAS